MPIKAADFTALKARVKAECLRRNQTGSVASYGGSSYDYTVSPASGKRIDYEHYTKLADPLTAIDGTTRKPKTRINKADIDDITNTITALEAKSMTASTLDNTGCSASCTGLCLSTCSGGCGNNCTGTCSGGCSNTCSGTCTSYCANSCTMNCANNCFGDCWEVCGQSCTGSCSMACGNSTTAACQGSCWAVCANGSGSSQSSGS